MTLDASDPSAAWYRAEGFERTVESLSGWDVGIVSYALRGTWICKIDNVSPGANIARATGATREEARAAAIAKAAPRLLATRRR